MNDIDQNLLIWRDIEFGVLLPAANRENYLTHLAALEWSLDPSILINSAEDIESREHWNETLEPYEHQVQNLITFCRRAPVALIADDVGLGKTISAGLILSELRTRGKVDTCLIIAPKLLGPQWAEELRSKFKISAKFVTGNEIQNIQNVKSVLITTYDSASRHMKHISKLDFQMVILDEAHHLRNLYGTAKPPKRALNIRNALENRNFKFVVMLTATPIHNRLWDLYSLVDLLSCAKGHINPFGDKHDFALRYINDGKTTARVLNSGREAEFRKRLSEYMVRTRREDCDLEFPERTVSLCRAKPSQTEKDLYELVMKVGEDLSALVKLSLAQALMSSPHALIKQLENMSGRGSASISKAKLDRAKMQVAELDLTGKEAALFSLLDKIANEKPEDWRAVIFTSRIETQTRLGDVLKEKFGRDACGFIRGGKAFENQKAVQHYSEDVPRVHVLVSTDSGAEGINLQKGNVVINFDLPWNPMVLEQRIGRVQRLGSMHEYVSILNLVVGGSVEETVVGRLAEKLTAISSTIGDVEGILETIEPGDDDSGEGYEKSIRKLVLASLAGKDVEKAVARHLASIEKAKKLYQEEQKHVEKNLGKLDAMHREGPMMPKLSSVKPRLSEKEFTMAALCASEGEMVEDDGVYRYIRTGRAPEIICFNRVDARKYTSQNTISGGPSTGVYLHGQPKFERLVSQWSGKEQLFVKDGSDISNEHIRMLISKWLKSKDVNVRLVDLKKAAVEKGFKGEVSVCSAATVAHDKYEKIIEFEHHLKTSKEPPSGFEDRIDTVLGEANASSVLHDAENLVKEHVLKDTDIIGFVRFYQERFGEEQEKADGLEHLEIRAEEDYTPNLSVRVEGLYGLSWSIYEVKAGIELQEGVLSTEVFTIGSWGEVLSGPEIVRCELTGQAVPSHCIEVCAVSKRRCLISEMVQSQFSDKYALPEYIVVCGKTGNKILLTESACSDISGQRVNSRLLKKTDSGRFTGLLEEFVLCGATGKKCAPEELEKSDVSEKLVFKDEMVEGAGKAIKGHSTEFLTCTYSQKLYLPEEIAKSDYSESDVFIENLVPSDLPPHRKGMPSEIIDCEVSHRRLLLDEVKPCEVTGKIVGLDLLFESAFSNKYALEECFGCCEETEDRVLLSEMAICEYTGKNVRKDLLMRSDVSGLRVLERCLITSANGEKRGLPDEMIRCEWDGRCRVPDELTTCRFSGLQVATSYTANGILDRILKLQSIPSFGSVVRDEEFKTELKKYSTKFRIKNIRSITNRVGDVRIFAGEKGGALFGAKHLEYAIVKEDRFFILGSIKNPKK
jgi:superfamily II DNA or RNA helicase